MATILEKVWLPFFLSFLVFNQKFALKKVSGSCFFTRSNRYCCIIKGQGKGDFYCKRALKQNLKAYSWASFGLLYSQYKKPCAGDDDPHDAVRNKLKRYNLLLSYCNPNGEQYQKLKKRKSGLNTLTKTELSI